MRAFGEEAVASAVEIHDPEFVLVLVVDLVGPAPRVDDLLAVGRDPRRGDHLPVEEEVNRQAVFRPRPGPRLRRERGDEGGRGKEDPPRPHLCLALRSLLSWRASAGKTGA